MIRINASGRGCVACTPIRLQVAKASSVPPSELSPIAKQAPRTRQRNGFERIERDETVKGGLGNPLTRKEAEAIMMQAGMTRADIRRSVRMAQLPKELHETILAEVMRRKRLAQNVAINAVWRAFQRLGG
jgi:hypothetical protein